MLFQLTVSKKEAVNKFTEAEYVSEAGKEGKFEADNISFAKRVGTEYFLKYIENRGLKVRRKEDWVTNRKNNTVTRDFMLVGVDGVLNLYRVTLVMCNVLK